MISFDESSKHVQVGADVADSINASLLELTSANGCTQHSSLLGIQQEGETR